MLTAVEQKIRRELWNGALAIFGFGGGIGVSGGAAWLGNNAPHWVSIMSALILVAAIGTILTALIHHAMYRYPSPSTVSEVPALAPPTRKSAASKGNSPYQS